MEKRDGSASGEDAGRPQVQNGALSPREMAIADYAAREARELAVRQCAKIADDWRSILNAWYSDETREEVRDRHAARANLCVVIAKEIRDLTNAAAPVDDGEEQGFAVSGEGTGSPHG